MIIVMLFIWRVQMVITKMVEWMFDLYETDEKIGYFIKNTTITDYYGLN